MYQFDADITTFGLLVLMKLDIKLVSEFIKFSKENNTLRDINDVGGSIDKVQEYYDLQQGNILGIPNVIWSSDAIPF